MGITPSVVLPPARYGVPVPIKDSVFITVDGTPDGGVRIYKGDGKDDATEILAKNPSDQEEEIIDYIQQELAPGRSRKHHVVIKAGATVKHREVARVSAAVSRVEELEQLHIGVLEAK
jgi:hypothetical protein